MWHGFIGTVLSVSEDCEVEFVSPRTDGPRSSLQRVSKAPPIMRATSSNTTMPSRAVTAERNSKQTYRTKCECICFMHSRMEMLELYHNHSHHHHQRAHSIRKAIFNLSHNKAHAHKLHKHTHKLGHLGFH